MSQTLSSDILEAQFGPTEVNILHQDENVRIICNKVVGGGQVLEISRVVFAPAGAEKFPEAHQAVLGGESMGKAFRLNGIPFRRQVKTAYRQLLPANFGRWFGGNGRATVVDVSVLAGERPEPYADILEVYAPAVRWPGLKGRPTAEQLERIRSIDEFLAGRSLAGQ